MNISKKKSQKIINKLNEIEKLIDEKAYKSADRAIEEAIKELNNIEDDWEKWRKDKNDRA